ncbi:MAG: YggS family pyridoxal phosphate enzyme [Nitrospirales bacterium]|nr:MAG: YggS family pyridoxal phosphate enzyme [Nitrospirales bacterium]
MRVLSDENAISDYNRSQATLSSAYGMVNAEPVSCSIAENIQLVVQSIQQAALRTGRDPQDIRVVAVTKTVMADRLRQAHASGLRTFGENRLQEAQQKQGSLQDLRDVSWHFIGQVQRRKIKDVVGQFHLIHSVESLEQATAMDTRARDMDITQAILLQVNVSGEATKGGFSVPEVKTVLPEFEKLQHLTVRGLMTIPPWSKDGERARPYFRALRELAQTVEQQDYERTKMEELSMGMSRDYPVAVEEGATLVRIGTALFGTRNPVG